MNWDDVRVFLAVARSGQMLAAARSLGLNHATVARRVDALEAALGSRLFERRTTGSALSAEGERFLPFAERMESEAVTAREATGSSSTILSGTVRIGAPDGFGVGYLAARLGDLLEQHPGLKIELVPVSRSFSLSRREADIAVTLERPREGRLVARKLVDYTLGLYAARRYLQRNGRPRTADELPDHRLVGYVDDLLFTSALNYTPEIHKAWQTTLAVSSALGQMAAVRAGAGIGILHTFMARTDRTLVNILPDRIIERSYWMVVHEDLRGIARIDLVAGYIASAVRADQHLFR